MLIGSIAEAGRGQHLCQVYRDQAGLREAVADFVAAGLAAHDLVIHVSGSDGAAVCSDLRADGVDCEDALEHGQLRVIPVPAGDSGTVEAVTAVVTEMQRILDDPSSAAFGGARLLSEVDRLYAEEPPAEMVQRERLGDQFLSANGMVGLCLYDRRRHDSDFLLKAAAAHAGQVVPAAEVYRDEILAIGRADDNGALVTTGRVDLSNRGAFGDAVTQAVRSHAGDLVVDLSGLAAIDVGGLRVLARAAATNPARRVLLVAPPRGVRRMLRLTGWHRMDNLVVVDAEGRP